VPRLAVSGGKMPFNPNEIDPGAAALAALGGIIGRLIGIARSDDRRWGWRMSWELPIAVGMGWIGAGIAEFFNLQGFTAYAVMISAGYIGPRMVDEVFDRMKAKV
jgi:hypothetical protein